MTPQEAGEVVSLLLAAYPTQRQRMTERDAKAMTLAYANALLDLDVDAARAAVSSIVLTEEWIPTIAALRATAAELAQGRARSGDEAWGDVVEAQRRFGSYRAPGVDFEFADPLVAEVVRRFGWDELCKSENQIADRAHFMRAYDDLAAAAARDRSTSGALRPSARARAELPGGVRAIAAPAARPQICAVSGEDRAAIEQLRQQVLNSLTGAKGET